MEENIVSILIGLVIGIFIAAIVMENSMDTKWEKQIISHGCATYDSNLELKWKGLK